MEVRVWLPGLCANPVQADMNADGMIEYEDSNLCSE